MTLQQLEYVVALDTHRHFVTAAKHCFVSQPTLTMQVKKLEEEIGALIFDRKKSPLEPTAFGEQVVLKARQILREANQLKELVSHERESLAGEFRIGVIPTVAPYIVPKFLGAFSEEFQNTRLSIEEMRTTEIIDALKHDLLDVGLLVTPLRENELREIPVYYEPFMVYASPDHHLANEKEITQDSITPEGLWLLNQGHCFRDQTLQICHEKNRPVDQRFTYESGSIETLKALIQNNGGYTLIPELSANKQDKGFLKPFEDPKPVREVSLVVHHSFVKEGLLDALRKHILEMIPKQFARNDNFFRVKWR